VSRLRLLVVASLCTLVVVAAPAGAGTENTGVAVVSRTALERSIVAEINAIRASRGLRRLTVSRPLAQAAQSHSHDMARLGYFGHDSSNGQDFGERVRRFYGSNGYSWRAGENILWESPDTDPAGAVEMWLESASHRRILLTPGWREIGLSAVHAVSGRGVFEGLEVTVVTADFGVRTR
jgi:uncharacterized protein YkwD